jgi:Pertussis toxin, subunit 1
MKNYKKYIIFLSTMFVITNIYAVSNVYRADTEAPDTVFQNGIVSQRPGGSDNLLTHLEGYSMREGNDNLISTVTEDINFNMFNAPRFYVYTIRADPHFFDVNLSLQFCFNHPVIPVAQAVCEDLLQNEEVQTGHHFIIRNNIPTANIYSARVFNYNTFTHQYQPGETTYNPNYRALPTGSNPYPYDITADDVTDLFGHMGVNLAFNEPNDAPLPVNRGMPIGLCPIRRTGSHMKSSLTDNLMMNANENFGCKHLAWVFLPLQYRLIGDDALTEGLEDN